MQGNDKIEDQLGLPIAFGRTAEVYTWKNERMLKLFYDWYKDEYIEHERRISRAVHAAGLPVPFVGDIVQKEGRTALVYEHIKGITMSKMMSTKPWTIFPLAARMAELHFKMHATTIEADIPKQRQRIRDKISEVKVLPTALQSKVLTALENLSDGDRLCHGDFHPGNIILSGNREITIDWADTSLGNPMADLARTSIILLGSAENVKKQNPLIKPFVHIFHKRYIRHYFLLNPGGETEYSRWLPIIAAARLSENITELEKWLIMQTEMIDKFVP